MNTIRCKHPEILALDALISTWPLRHLSYYQSIAYPGVDAGQVAAEYREAWRRVTAVCGMTVTESADPGGVQVIATSGAIDGQYGVLAETELPNGSAGFVSHQLFDSAEIELSSEQRIACMAHEICHALGVGHAVEGSGNLMEPVISAISRPQPGFDIPQLQERFGPPALQVLGTVTFEEPGTYQITYDPVENQLQFTKQ